MDGLYFVDHYHREMRRKDKSQTLTTATPVWEADGISEEKKTAGVKDIGHILFNKQGGQWLAMGHGWSFKNYSLKYAYAL